ncbi:MAG: YraN family protein [Chloroflexota bacterium]|nr:YraN family protein [Chloroflexota bacterium]
MSHQRRDLGRQGEQLAADLLAREGYEIVARNWRHGAAGELDLVAVDGSCLVFVEVRTRRGVSFGTPEESVTPEKQARLFALAEAYEFEYHWEGPMRIDVVGITMSQNGQVLRINHLKDVVVAS